MPQSNHDVYLLRFRDEFWVIGKALRNKTTVTVIYSHHCRLFVELNGYLWGYCIMGDSVKDLIILVTGMCVVDKH